MLGQDVGFPVPQGGAGQLPAALRRRAEASGVSVRCGAPGTRGRRRAGPGRGGHPGRRRDDPGSSGASLPTSWRRPCTATWSGRRTCPSGSWPCWTGSSGTTRPSRSTGLCDRPHPLVRAAGRRAPAPYTSVWTTTAWSSSRRVSPSGALRERPFVILGQMTHCRPDPVTGGHRVGVGVHAPARPGRVDPGSRRRARGARGGSGGTCRAGVPRRCRRPARAVTRVAGAGQCEPGGRSGEYPQETGAHRPRPGRCGQAPNPCMARPASATPAGPPMARPPTRIPIRTSTTAGGSPSSTTASSRTTTGSRSASRGRAHVPVRHRHRGARPPDRRALRAAARPRAQRHGDHASRSPQAVMNALARSHRHLRHRRDLRRTIPDVMVGARRGSPLIVGVGEGENFLASDATAIVAHTRQVVYLNDYDVVTLTAGPLRASRTSAPTPPRCRSASSSSTPEAAERGEFPHFMLKEIFEQPQHRRERAARPHRSRRGHRASSAA